MSTLARVMTFNVRLSNMPQDIGNRSFTKRRQYVIQAIREDAPSIIGFQECDPAWRDYIETKLGPELWARIGEHNPQIFYRVDKWVPLNIWHLSMPSGLRKRYAVAARMQSIKTGETFLMANTHLAASTPTEPFASRLRHAQIRLIAEWLSKLPDWDKAVLTGDFNSDGQSDGVRKIALEYGLRGLRRRMSPDPPGSQWRSFNGFKRTVEGEQIDDILSRPKIGIHSAALEFTCPRRFPVAASDHNLWRATVEFTGGLPLP